jgi:hypothetical protein
VHEKDDAGLRQRNKDKLGIVTKACHSYIQSKRPDENIVAKRNRTVTKSKENSRAAIGCGTSWV